MQSGGKVFGIGLSKTGTTSLYAALDLLGYRAATFRHMRELGLKSWLSGDFSRDWFASFDAVTDLPVGTWFRELDERYPGSKFILTARDVEPWLASVERQFTANPDPDDRFIRDVRLAQYGVTTFNAARFRRIHADHRRAVRDHFADRPGDILEIDVFSGAGWPELCGFLGHPIPSAPFPSVKPGFSPKRTAATDDRGPLAFVLPVVHPEGAKVSDYRTVERVLRLTLQSLLAQSDPATRIVVVCHRIPDWADGMGPAVHFIDLGSTPGFEANRNDVQIDKGMKYVIGSLYATERLGAGKVMLTDADDFVHRDLGPYLNGVKAPKPGRDGWILVSGYHAALLPEGGDVRLAAAFRVREFNQTCGSCRIFRSEALRAHIRGIDPGLGALADGFRDDEVQPAPPALAAAVVAAATPAVDQPDSMIRLLGRHTEQHPFFDFAPVPAPLVAKGCGHGNHDGPRKGDIHWARITGLGRTDAFARDFGLADTGLRIEPSARMLAKGALAALRTTFRKPFRRARRKIPI
ncbi:MAG: sulfotransferase [Paracoccaceae bacterium]